MTHLVTHPPYPPHPHAPALALLNPHVPPRPPEPRGGGRSEAPGQPHTHTQREERRPCPRPPMPTQLLVTHGIGHTLDFVDMVQDAQQLRRRAPPDTGADTGGRQRAVPSHTTLTRTHARTRVRPVSGGSRSVRQLMPEAAPGTAFGRMVIVPVQWRRQALAPAPSNHHHFPLFCSFLTSIMPLS